MDKSHIDLHPLSSASARDLLEKYTYGSGDVELILRFAEDHNLEKDNLVWLFTSILKVGSNLLNDRLRAIQHTGEIVAVAETQRRTSMQNAAELADRLAANVYRCQQGRRATRYADRKNRAAGTRRRQARR